LGVHSQLGSSRTDKSEGLKRLWSPPSWLRRSLLADRCTGGQIGFRALGCFFEFEGGLGRALGGERGIFQRFTRGLAGLVVRGPCLAAQADVANLYTEGDAQRVAARAAAALRRKVSGEQRPAVSVTLPRLSLDATQPLVKTRVWQLVNVLNSDSAKYQRPLAFASRGGPNGFDQVPWLLASRTSFQS